MKVGIEKLNLYAGRLCLDIADLAEARGLDPDYVATRLMCKTRSVYPPYEDGVTLAVNAAKRLLAPEDIDDIELLIVGTESSVDFGKPISTWVHRFCNLPSNCRNFEVKHACYSSTGALKMAASWVLSNVRPGKKALVISADYTRNILNTQAEPIGGGGAAAMLVSDNPQLLEIELDKSGYWTHEIADTFRPTARLEMMVDDGQISLNSYLDALEGAYSHYEQMMGEVDYDADFKKHIYHSPFPGMTFMAHSTLLQRSQPLKKREVQQNFQEKVAEGLYFIQRIGGPYGSSTFFCLLGLLHHAQQLAAGDKISLFAYGSGCQSEFYHGFIGPQAIAATHALDLDRHLSERERIGIEDYEANENAREKHYNYSSYRPDFDLTPGLYEKSYAGQGLLVLKQVENYHRRYEWS